MQQRKRYSEELKREAVGLTRLPSVNVSQIARDLGIRANQIHHWRKDLETNDKKAFPGNGVARDQELLALKLELAQVKKERDFFTRCGGLFRQGIALRYEAIRRHRSQYPIRLMCRCLKVSPSVFHGRDRRSPSARARDNARLLDKIRQHHADSDGRTVHARALGLRRRDGQPEPRCALDGRRWPVRNPAEAAPAAQAIGRAAGAVRNHLERKLLALEPNSKWVIDITYIKTGEGCCTCAR